MDYLAFIEQFHQPYTILYSGNDQYAQKRVFNDICQKSKRANKSLIILSDNESFDMSQLKRFGYTMVNGFSSGHSLYHLFDLHTLSNLSRFRQILDILNYDENQKMKLVSYIKLIQYLEELRGNKQVTLETLIEYSSNLYFEMKINEIIDDEEQKMFLLSKYSENAGAAADFENMLYLLEPFIKGKSFQLCSQKAIIYQISQFRQDKVLKELITKLLSFALENCDPIDYTIVVLDNGYGQRDYLLDFIINMYPHIDMNIISKDIFTLCEYSKMSALFNHFTVRIYAQHLSMESCEKIEKSCGEIDIVKNSYSVSYDRRLGSNRPWDILLGKNKNEVYTQNVPIREPRYRKEIVNSFSHGECIVEYQGNSSIFIL